MPLLDLARRSEICMSGLNVTLGMNIALQQAVYFLQFCARINLTLPRLLSMITSLHQAKRGQHLKVLSLPMESDLYGRLTAMGIGVGSELTVLRLGSPGKLLHLSNGVIEFMMRADLAKQISVEPLMRS